MSKDETSGNHAGAFSLTERIVLRNSEGERPFDKTVGEEQLRKWLATPAFSDEKTLEHFLGTHSLDRDRFIEILGTSPENLPDFPLNPSLFASADVSAEAAEKMEYAVFLEPLTKDYADRLRKVVSGVHADLPGLVDETAVASLVESLTRRLNWIIKRTLVLETNVFRVNHRLKGDSPQDRFNFFLRLISQEETKRELLGEYPVLARLCDETCGRWLEANEEFFRRLGTDFPALEGLLETKGLGSLAQVEGGGDSHCGGRSVLIATFSSGKKLVYKPRNLAVDLHFQALLRWLNEKGQQPPLLQLKVLSRPHHGWVEFVHKQACQSPAEIDRFYRRQGALLAVLHALGANDMHLENVLAAGEHPFIVDLETVFLPRLSLVQPRSAEEFVGNEMMESVTSVGLLPRPIWKDGKAIDLSGMGGGPNQETTLEAYGFVAAKSDEIRVAKIQHKTQQVHNRVEISGTIVDADNFKPLILEGFRDTYQIILAAREEFLAGPFRAFCGETTRVLARSTSTYEAFLHDSYHPNVLRDALDRDRLISQIWCATQIRPFLIPLMKSEHAQLLVGDIPYFSTRPLSLDLKGGDGAEIKNVLGMSGFDAASAKVEKMGEKDLERQLWLIKASFASLKASGTSQPNPPVAERNQASSPLAAAEAIGDRLEVLAFDFQDRAGWMSMRYEGDMEGSATGYTPSPAGPFLYDGVAGIALFFAYLDALAPRASRRKLAKSALSSVEAAVRDLGPHAPLGAFSGLGGVLYLYCQLGTLWSEETLLDQAEALLPAIERALETDESLDVISGCAGCIPCLLGLAKLRPASRAKEIALLCGERLLAKASSSSGNWEGAKVEIGFSHGIAGKAWALAELGAFTEEARFEQAAFRALGYERDKLSQGIWSDGQETGNPQCAWCHGAPGIALGRVALQARSRDPALLADIQSAFSATTKFPPLRNHGLCHGALGNLEMLWSVAQTLSHDEAKRAFEDHYQKTLAEILTQGWRTAIPDHIEIPGLMTGLAGIGYGLLRRVDPGRVPCVLTLSSAPSS